MCHTTHAITLDNQIVYRLHVDGKITETYLNIQSRLLIHILKRLPMVQCFLPKPFLCYLILKSKGRYATLNTLTLS